MTKRIQHQLKINLLSAPLPMNFRICVPRQGQLRRTGFSMPRIALLLQGNSIFERLPPAMFSRAVMNANAEETRSSRLLTMLDIFAELIPTRMRMCPKVN
jgi:hypothetical protein